MDARPAQASQLRLSRCERAPQNRYQEMPFSGITYDDKSGWTKGGRFNPGIGGRVVPAIVK